MYRPAFLSAILLLIFNLHMMKSKSIFRTQKYMYVAGFKDCKSGNSFRDECYQISNVSMSWSAARDSCQQNGGQLAMIEKRPVLHFINNAIKHRNDFFWMGMVDYNKEHNYKWLDGRDVDQLFIEMAGTDMVVSNKSEAGCVALTSSGHDLPQLSQEPCDRKLRFICQQMSQVDSIAVEQLNTLAEKKQKKIEREKHDIFSDIVRINKKAGVESRMYQGDIQLSPEQTRIWRAGGDPWAWRRRNETKAHTRQKRATTNNPDWIWPKGEVFYTFNLQTQTPENIKLVKDGMRDIETKTCIKFVERTTQNTYITITANGACSSQVGAYPGETYDVNLGPECTDELGRMQHELMHAIGFFHEQARPDRDDWVKIHIENVQQGREQNFDKMSVSESDNLGYQYDYESVMHYGPYAFSKDMDADLRTITTLRPPDADIGQRNRMSEIDVAQINKMYKCPNPVNGNWGLWQSWGSCTVTCGGGTRTRTRKCDSPAPFNGGLACPGSGSHTEACMTQNCPVPTLVYNHLGCWKDENLPEMLTSIEGKSSYLDGNYVNRTNKIQKCANAAKSMGVEILGLRFGGKCLVLETGQNPSTYRSSGPSADCKNGVGATNAMDVYTLNTGPLDGQWGVWTAFSVCSVTCGLGKRTRTRVCNNPQTKNGGQTCQGSASENQDCNHKPCNVDGGWSSWSSQGQCSVTCGQGTRTRTRTCTAPAPSAGGMPCQGSTTTAEPCTLGDCPVNGGWSAWGALSTCSATCGPGTQSRTRTCTNPLPQNSGNPCSGSGILSESCKIKDCPIDGGWSSWGLPSACSRTCGVGTRTRTRTCTNPEPQHGGNQCPGDSTAGEVCNTQRQCAVNGAWSEWGRPGVCTKTCGSGTRTRTRQCNNPPPTSGGLPCPGNDSKTEPCSSMLCPVDGGWSAWSHGSCSQTCGRGTRTKTRTCTNPSPVGAGKTCGGSWSDIEQCSVNACPVNGAWSQWSLFGTCTKTCASGSKVRTRTCTNPKPANGGLECDGESVEKQDCNTFKCPVDGAWSAWSNPGSCSVTCGSGSRTRTRKCDNPAPADGGKLCTGDWSKTEICVVSSTCESIVDGGWSVWIASSVCSKSCGSGTLTKTRTCTAPRPSNGGKPCVGISNDLVTCNTQPCPIDGAWSSWSGPGQCSTTCGPGIRVRTRICNNPSPAFGGQFCVGGRSRSEQCSVQSCPLVVNGGWSVWVTSPCSRSCGAGQQTRTRTCSNPAPLNGGQNCTGTSQTLASCNDHLSCPVAGGWSTWARKGSCSLSCGGGVRTLTRSCTNPAPSSGGALCRGIYKRTEICNAQECSSVTHGSWTSWSLILPCSRTCNGGLQTYNRSCSNPVPANGGSPCVGPDVKVTVCNNQDCLRDGGWGAWTDASTCSSSCGRGTRTRKRQCDSPAPAGGGRTCSGASTQYEVCVITQNCDVVNTESPITTSTNDVSGTPPVVSDGGRRNTSLAGRMTTWFRQFITILTSLFLFLTG